jgi:hypothetical protein
MTPVVFPIGVVMNYVVNNTLSTSSRRGEPGDKTVNRDIIKPAKEVHAAAGKSAKDFVECMGQRGRRIFE